MPTIKFNAGFDETTKRILNEEFRIVCHKLELTGDFVVNCTMKPIDKDGLYARVSGEKSPHEFDMEMNSNKFNLFDATASFAHELIHVEQHLKGWLVVHNTGNFAVDGISWKGEEFFPAFAITFSDNCIPWEIDAWKRMGELHKYVVAHLPEHDRALIDISKSTGLNKTWNADYQPWSGCDS